MVVLVVPGPLFLFTYTMLCWIILFRHWGFITAPLLCTTTWTNLCLNWNPQTAWTDWQPQLKSDGGGIPICGTLISFPAVSPSPTLCSRKNHPSKLYFLHGACLKTKKCGTGTVWQLSMIRVLVWMKYNLWWTLWGSCHGPGIDQKESTLSWVTYTPTLMFNNVNATFCVCA